MTKYRVYLAVLALIFIAAVYAQLQRPQPLDWRHTYRVDDKVPYGTYVLYTMLPGLFPGAAVDAVETTFFELPQGRDSTADVNYIFVGEKFTPDQTSIEALLQFAARGNQIFIAATQFHKAFSDSLNFAIADTWNFGTARDSESQTGSDKDLEADAEQIVGNDSVDIEPESEKGSLSEADGERNLPGTFNAAVNFLNPALRADSSYAFTTSLIRKSFTFLDSLRTTALGEFADGGINFIHIEYGKGGFYISTIPLMFTNYNLLSGANSDYVASALSYLPVKDVLWDQYDAEGRYKDRSELRVLMAEESLKWSWRTALIAVLLFLVFKARRRQRVVPVLTAPANATLSFVTTIGRLYFQHNDHVNVAGKKITHLLEYIRARYRLKTNELDEDFIARLALKSGVDHERVAGMIASVSTLRRKRSISTGSLIDLNYRIDSFYRESNY